MKQGTLEKIQNLAVSLQLVTVEDMRKHSLPQLVTMIANKLNELMNEVHRFETDVIEMVETQNENIQYLLGEGLHLEVVTIFEKWMEDGTFDTLINQTALKEINNRIDETNAQLSDIRNSMIKFKPKFSASLWLGGVNDDYGNYDTHSKEEIKAYIDSYKSYGIKNFIIPIEIAFNKNTNNFYIAKNLENIDYAIDYADSIGCNVNCIKLHLIHVSNETIRLVGSTNFQATITSLVDQLGDRFKSKNITYFTVANELSFIYGDRQYNNFVISLMTSVKNKGFKTGITNAGFIDLFFNTTDEIKDQADAYFINFYPSISNKKEYTTVNDAIVGFESSGILPLIEKVKRQGKPIIISECGIQDYWESLSQPEKWEWVNPTVSNGEAPYLFMNAVFNVLNLDMLDEFWWFYSANYPTVKKLLKEYIGGE